jgi:uncharacterized protein (TIGR00369 family)
MNTLHAKLISVSVGEVRISLSPRPELTQQHGYTHAGALTSVLDTACGYAAMSAFSDGVNVLTVEFKVNFIRPAVADRFVAIGKVVKAGKTLTVCQGELIGERGASHETIAVMQATIINIKGAA